MDKDTYQTLHGSAECEFKVSGSRFIGFAAPVRIRIAAEEIIDQRRKFHYAATHHCYAYRLGMGEEEIFRYADAGEPAGTAGKPIYNVLLGRELTNVVLIVTRYFGGTKLGTGGLARAYATTAARTLDTAQVETCFLTHAFRFAIGYDLVHTVMNLLNRVEARIEEADYRELVDFTVHVRLSRAEAFKIQLIESTGARIVFSETNESRENFPRSREE